MGLLVVPVVLWLHVSAFASCVTLSWTAPGDDGRQGKAYQYDLRYSITYITENTWALCTPVNSEPTPDWSGERQYCTIDNLQPGTRYFFAIRARDEQNNWSPLSNVTTRLAPEDECFGVRGNADCDLDEIIDIGDVTTIAAYLFLGGPLCCREEANLDGEGYVDISDLTVLINYLFVNLQTTVRTCP